MTMTRADALAQAIAEATGNPVAKVSDCISLLFAAGRLPECLSEEIGPERAQALVRALQMDKDGLRAWLERKCAGSV